MRLEPLGPVAFNLLNAPKSLPLTGASLVHSATNFSAGFAQRVCWRLRVFRQTSPRKVSKMQKQLHKSSLGGVKRSNHGTEFTKSAQRI
jgi:hypothetical protein